MKTLAIVLFFTAGAFIFSCGGGSGDPLDSTSGGALGPGAGMANLAVTASNQYEACQVFNEQIISSFAKGIKIFATTAGPETSLRITGSINGSCTVEEIGLTSGGGSMPYASNLAMSYYNYYSDTGTLFFNGELALVGQWSMVNNQVQVSTCFVTGTIEISGDYSGTVQFDRFSIILENGRPRNLPEMVEQGPTCVLAYDGSMTYTFSSNSKMVFNPYSFDSEGCDF